MQRAPRRATFEPWQGTERPFTEQDALAMGAVLLLGTAEPAAEARPERPAIPHPPPQPQKAALQRDPLAGGFVPAHSSPAQWNGAHAALLRSFLPLVKPGTPPRTRRRRVRRDEAASFASTMPTLRPPSTRTVLSTPSSPVRSPAATPRRGSPRTTPSTSPRRRLVSPGTSDGWATHRASRSSSAASHTTKDLLVMNESLGSVAWLADGEMSAVRRSTHPRVKNGPIETMRVAQSIGLLAETEQCAATILQAVARMHRARHDMSKKRLVAKSCFNFYRRLKDGPKRPLARENNRLLQDVGQAAYEHHKVREAANRDRAADAADGKEREAIQDRFQAFKDARDAAIHHEAEVKMERQKESMRGMPQNAKVYVTRSGRRSAFDSGDLHSPDVDVDARREKKREMVRQRHADALALQKQRREEMDAKYEQIEAARTKIYAEDCKQWSRHQTRASRRLHSKLMQVMLDAWLAHKAAYDKCAGSDRNVDLACESMLSLRSESASEGGVSTQKSQLSFERVGTNAPMAGKVAKSEMAGMALQFLSPSVRAKMEEKVRPHRQSLLCVRRSCG